MKVIMGNKGSGKTFKSIIVSSREWKYILVRDEKEVRHVVEMAKKMKVTIPYPITINEILFNRSNFDSIKVNGIIVDNALEVLQEVIKVPIELATINVESVNYERSIY